MYAMLSGSARLNGREMRTAMSQFDSVVLEDREENLFPTFSGELPAHEYPHYDCFEWYLRVIFAMRLNDAAHEDDADADDLECCLVYLTPILSSETMPRWYAPGYDDSEFNARFFTISPDTSNGSCKLLAPHVPHGDAGERVRCGYRSQAGKAELDCGEPDRRPVQKARVTCNLQNVLGGSRPPGPRQPPYTQHCFNTCNRSCQLGKPR